MTDYPDYDKVPVKGRLKVCLDLLFNQTTRGKVLLDIGSSNGLLISKLKDKGFRKIIGVEPSVEAVKISKQKIRFANFYVSTADKLPVGNGTVDLVTMFDVIEHVPVNGETDAFNEIARILKKGGTLLLSTPNNNLFTNLLDPAWYLGHRHYNAVDVKKFIENAGFKVQTLEVKGNLWFSIYLILLYFAKHLLGVDILRNEFLEKMDDQGFKKEGIHTIFVVAKKIWT